MRKMNLHYLLSVSGALLIFITGCSKCNACYGLYSPDDCTPGQWETIISSMGPRTGLPASDIALITKYVSRGQ